MSINSLFIRVVDLRQRYQGLVSAGLMPSSNIYLGSDKDIHRFDQVLLNIFK